jgi:IS4 transposase
LLRCLVQLLPARTLLRLPALGSFYDRLFNPLVSLWLLLFQRLNADHSLDAALTHARAGGADRLKAGLSTRLRSASTASYSDARQRLPEPFLVQVLQRLGSQISGLSSGPGWRGWRLVLLDGTTVRLRSYGNIPKHFPSHGNQHVRAGYWCLMRTVAGFCALTGAALDCALGSTHLSEQILGSQLILRAAGRCWFVGDRNFGVFLIAQAAAAKGHQVLLRLTDRRAAKLLGRPLRPGDHPVRWQATGQCQRHPDLSAQPIPGRLLVARLQRRGFRSLQLCLFTTSLAAADHPLRELVKLYGRRWQVELNLRYVKAQMEAAQLEAHSAEMARKEWLATLIAYNLIRAAMLCAALHTQTDPLNLSFSACRRQLECWLRHFGSLRRHPDAKWRQLLDHLGRCKLPTRRKPRPNEPRAQPHLRQSFPPLRGSRSAARKLLQKNQLKS